MLMQTPFLLENSLGWPIRGEVRWVEVDAPEAAGEASAAGEIAAAGETPDKVTPVKTRARRAAPPGRRPVIVICHGFKGFKDWGMFPWLAESLATAGFRVITFNFGGSGIGDQPDQFTELDRFHRNTLSLEIEELELILDAVGRGELPGGGEPRPNVGLLGHSRGGVVASVATARRTDVSALSIWAGVGVLDWRYPEAVRRAWRAAGELEVMNARTGQRMPVGLEGLEDLERNLDSYSPHQVLPLQDRPTLWIHGSGDATIPVEEAAVVDRAMKDRPGFWRFVVLDDADHTFGSVHPFRGPTTSLLEAQAETERFFDVMNGG